MKKGGKISKVQMKGGDHCSYINCKGGEESTGTNALNVKTGDPVN